MMPIFEWLLRSAVMAGLVGVGAWSLESLLRGWNRPARYVWVGALVFSVTLPLLSIAAPDVWPVAVRRVVEVNPAPPVEWIPATVATQLASLPDQAATVTQLQPSRRVSARAILICIWLSASVTCALRWTYGWLRLRRARRGWRALELGQESVYVTDRFGPAVVGLRNPSIVLPAWMVLGDNDRLRMIVRHESEHARAGDQWLLAFAPLAIVLFPLNPALWWQHRRLRLAVEVDCDARVLRAGESALDYGSMLLDVAGSVPGHSTLAMLSGPRTFLERRIRAMSFSRNRRSLSRALALFGLTSLSMVGALLAGAPTRHVVAQQQPLLAAPKPPSVRPPARRIGSRIGIGSLPPAPALHKQPGVPAVKPPSLRRPAQRWGIGPTRQEQKAPRTPPPVNASKQLPVKVPHVLVPRAVPPGGRQHATQQQQQREPILVVDGLVLGQQNRFDAIVNKLRIASVEILNSTEAVKRFGEAGRNGAVLVTTAPPESEISANRDQAATSMSLSATGKVIGSPLIIVDGWLTPLVGEKGLQDFRPENIERVEIIKGQAAVERYGERGRDGVILITTKK